MLKSLLLSLLNKRGQNFAQIAALLFVFNTKAGLEKSLFRKTRTQVMVFSSLSWYWAVGGANIFYFDYIKRKFYLPAGKIQNEPSGLQSGLLKNLILF